MVDLNFGIQQWFLQPSFIIKVLAGIFASATLIFMFVFDTQLYEYCWRKANKNGDFAAAITSFLIITILVTILIHIEAIIGKVPFIGNNKLFQVILAASFALFTLLLAIIYGIKYSGKIETTMILDFTKYMDAHLDDENFKQWLKDYANTDKADHYFDLRTTHQSPVVLGLFIFLAILDAILLAYFYLVDDGASLSIAKIDEPINSSNSVPSYN